MTAEETLVHEAMNGNDEAFIKLIKLYKVDLYKTALAFFRNEEEAIEAIQEVTYRAYKNIRKLREVAYVKTWLIRIMINYCHDQLKKNKRVVLDNEIINSQGISERFDAIEMREVFLNLDDRSREILTLKYFHDLKIKDIAAILHCPEGTIKTWLNKALKSLREQLEEKGGDKHVS